MAWTALMTFTANSVLTAAQLNTYIGSGGNLSETAPAKVTTAGDLVYATGANAITRLAVGAAGTYLSSTGTAPIWRDAEGASVSNSQSTTSTAFTDLTTGGPAVSVTTGTKALVVLTAEFVNSGVSSTLMGFDVSGATTIAAAITQALQGQGTSTIQASYVAFIESLTSGSNTFTAKYRVGAGTGTWANRRIFVMPL